MHVSQINFFPKGSQSTGRKRDEQMRIDRENEILKLKLSRHATVKGKAMAAAEKPQLDMQSYATSSSNPKASARSKKPPNENNSQSETKEAKEKYDEFDKLLKMYTALKGTSEKSDLTLRYALVRSFRYSE